MQEETQSGLPPKADEDAEGMRPVYNEGHGSCKLRSNATEAI